MLLPLNMETTCFSEPLTFTGLDLKPYAVSGAAFEEINLKYPARLWIHLASYIMRYRGSIPGNKAAGA
jgi:hypothetical protein